MDSPQTGTGESVDVRGRPIPAAWLKVMEPKRINSLRDLSRAADVSPQTITRLVHGERTSADTVRAVADALGLADAEVWELHGHPRPNPFRLDPSADDLSPTQRAAVKAVIAAMLERMPERAAGPRHLRVARRRGEDADREIT